MLGVLAVSVLFVLPHMGARRLPFWFSWLPWHTTGVFCLNVLVTGVLGVIAARASAAGGWQPTALDDLNNVAPALLLNLAARRSGGGNAGDSLAFRTAAWWHSWLQGRVETTVLDWAWDKEKVSVTRLNDLCAQHQVPTTRPGSTFIQATERAKLARLLGSAVPAKRLAAEEVSRNGLAHALVDGQKRRPR